jgi:hypothetical protein
MVGIRQLSASPQICADPEVITVSNAPRGPRAESTAPTDHFTVPSRLQPAATMGPITSSSSAGPGPGGKTELTVVFGVGTGPDDSWTLRCEPAGGTHPDAATACRVLEAAGEWALPPVDRSLRCAMVYGGPERATVTGTWRGLPVNSSFSRTNSCEIARWEALTDLLPRAGA